MEACLSVEREVDKVLQKFNHIKDHASRTLFDVIYHVENLRAEFDNYPSNHDVTIEQLSILKQTACRVKETVQYLTSGHRDLHSSVSKVGKAVDRHFIADLEAFGHEEIFADLDNERLLNQVICDHYYQQGALDISECLAKEAGLVVARDENKQFSEINSIVEALKTKDVSLALEWTERNRDFLFSRNSNLEFKLHRLKFIQLIEKGMSHQMNAIEYARTYLNNFVDSHKKEIQNLMGVFLYLPQGLSASPYAYYFTPTLWSEIIELFTSDACALLGLNIDSPLNICINVGCAALPALLNIKHVMRQRQVTNIWNGKDELPIDVDAAHTYQYHSIFACPILRQQSSKHNPPVRLVCGHVISRDALNKLVVNTNKLKCPYCPIEQTANEVMEIKF